MATSRDELRKYAGGFVVTSSAAFLCFFFVPILGPRPDVEVTNVMFRLLESYDRPLNCFPSLHVGLAVHTMLAAPSLLDGAWSKSTRHVVLILGWSWTALIAYAAIATKQHYAIDLPAGALLAYVARWSTSHIAQGARLMLKRQWVCLALLCSVWCATAVAQPVQTPPSPDGNDEAEHEALRRLKSGYEEAVRNNRIDALAPYFHSDFHGVMVTGRAVNGFGDVQQYWRDIRGLIGEGGTYATTVNPEPSVIVGDLALARGTTDDVVRTKDGQEYRFTTLWTATLQKEGGTWKIRTIQGTMDPIGNAFVREFGKRLVVRVSSAVGAATLILGALTGAVWQRRRNAR